MKPWFWFSISFVAIASWVSIAAAGAPDAPPATRLVVPEPAFYGATTTAAGTDVSRFRVVFKRDMPTPGYRFEVDGVEVDTVAGRIEVRVTEVAPDGMVAQVITPAELAIQLGPLDVRTYVLEIRLRRRGESDYRLSHATVLSAF